MLQDPIAGLPQWTSELLGTEHLLQDLGLSRNALQNFSPEQLESQIHDALASVRANELQEKIHKNWPCKLELGIHKLGLFIDPDFPRLSPQRFQAIIPEIERRLIEWAKSQFPTASPAARDIEEPAPKTHMSGSCLTRRKALPMTASVISRCPLPRPPSKPLGRRLFNG